MTGHRCAVANSGLRNQNVISPCTTYITHDQNPFSGCRLRRHIVTDQIQLQQVTLLLW
jgi:hypothetical protein